MGSGVRAARTTGYHGSWWKDKWSRQVSSPFQRTRSDTICFLKGVGGFCLGGGFSWKTNQFGLLIDTLVSVEVILPSGEIVQASNTTEPDLFFGLKVSFLSYFRGSTGKAFSYRRACTYYTGWSESIWHRHSNYSGSSPSACRLRKSDLVNN